MSGTYDEMCDVEVVLEEPYAERKETINVLLGHGLTVTNVDRDDGVVEGTIAASRLAELRQMEGVAYVRIVFTYLAEEPSDRAAATTVPAPAAHASDREVHRP